MFLALLKVPKEIIKSLGKKVVMQICCKKSRAPAGRFQGNRVIKDLTANLKAGRKSL